MRGTPAQSQYLKYVSGIIPAYAGNTCWCQRLEFRTRDHPRVCGEHRCRIPINTACSGSSPRMRGTLSSFMRTAVPTGIIPAYAGNTNITIVAVVPYEDHPRVCGEHDRIVGIIAVIPGSSPRMRGTRRLCRLRDQKQGIIPAYAGNTAKKRSSKTFKRDHPRVCGEHGVEREMPITVRGSSPRMRGTPIRDR